MTKGGEACGRKAPRYTTAVLHALECRDGSVTFFISTRGREGGD